MVRRPRGLLAGALAFGLRQPAVMPALSRVGALGRVTSAGLAGANPWLALLVFVEPVALTLALVARAGAPPDRAG